PALRSPSRNPLAASTARPEAVLLTPRLRLGPVVHLAANPRAVPVHVSLEPRDPAQGLLLDDSVPRAEDHLLALGRVPGELSGTRLLEHDPRDSLEGCCPNRRRVLDRGIHFIFPGLRLEREAGARAGQRFSRLVSQEVRRARLRLGFVLERFSRLAVRR